MILTLSAVWKKDPHGPFRNSEQFEDLWSLINAVGSIISGSSLFPWFLGESNEEELCFDGLCEELVLEFYASDQTHPSAVEYLPVIMLATEIGLRKGFSSFELSKIDVALHPGESCRVPTDPWWNNYFNNSQSHPRYVIEVSPEPSDLALLAESICPNLFSSDGTALLASSWGLVECASLVSVLSTIEPQWSVLSVKSRPLNAH